MSKVSAICDSDREMMMAFSNCCIERLSGHAPLKLFLLPFQGLLEANVCKESDKDCLVIEHAASAFAKGSSLADIDLDRLFEATKAIDSEFLSKFSSPFLSIKISHDDLEDIRKKRIRSFVEMVFKLLDNWRGEGTFPEIVQKTYTEDGYRTVLAEILELYVDETKLLGNSITGRGPAAKMAGFFAEVLFSTMEKTVGEISSDYSRRVFKSGSASFTDPGLHQAEIQP